MKAPQSLPSMNSRRIGISILIFGLAAYYFSQIFFIGDIDDHYRMAIQHLEGQGALPANFLYYLLVSLLTFDTGQTLSWASVGILALSVALKFYISSQYLAAPGGPGATPYALLLAFLLLLVAPLYIPQLAIGRMYLGSFTPTVWHNSTTIFVVPFAILLFIVSIKQLAHFTWPRCWAIIGLILINAAIKPSYLFVYAGALPFTLLFARGLTAAAALKQLLPVAVALAVIAVQKVMIFQGESIYSEGGVAIAPLRVYQAWHSFRGAGLLLFLLASVLTGILFPLYVLLRKGIARNDPATIFSAISFVGAILIFILLAETGERWSHGNFYWQVVPSGYILFLVAVRRSLPELSFPNRSIRDFNWYHALLLLHVLFGAIYALRIPLVGANY